MHCDRGCKCDNKYCNYQLKTLYPKSILLFILTECITRAATLPSGFFVLANYSLQYKCKGSSVLSTIDLLSWTYLHTWSIQFPSKKETWLTNQIKSCKVLQQHQFVIAIMKGLETFLLLTLLAVCECATKEKRSTSGGNACGDDKTTTILKNGVIYTVDPNDQQWNV